LNLPIKTCTIVKANERQTISITKREELAALDIDKPTKKCYIDFNEFTKRSSALKLQGWGIKINDHLIS